MEDFLIPDRQRIATALRSLAAVDRAPRVATSLNGAVSSTSIPQASSVIEIDLTHTTTRMQTSADAWRQRGIEPTYTPWFAEALVHALNAAPQANAAFGEDGIRRHAAVHLGVSLVGADGHRARHGVIRDADTRSSLGLGMELATIASTGSTDTSVLEQATVAMADYGPGSALYAVPLVLPGQVAAIRVGAVEQRLIALERGFALAPTAFVCASIDHRALDGMDAGALLGAMKRFLESA
jgi:pyruvate/2-oxoglutarate dehydrogenase complex dihydrolipoamide acyltransferase (E2) component